jgi:hypothetical protein
MNTISLSIQIQRIPCYKINVNLISNIFKNYKKFSNKKGVLDL